MSRQVSRPQDGSVSRKGSRIGPMGWIAITGGVIFAAWDVMSLHLLHHLLGRAASGVAYVVLIGLVIGLAVRSARRHKW